MGVLKNLVGSLVLAGSFIIPSSVEAQSVKPPEREIKLDFQNPVTNFEANSNDWYSLDQLTGKGSDVLYKEWKNNFFTRGGAMLLDHYFTHFFKFASHEFGHVDAAKKHGDFTTSYHWNDPFILNKNYFKKRKYLPTFEQDFEAIVGGLNHDEYNSYLTYKNNLDQISAHDGLSFLLNKLYDVGYIYNGPSSEEGGDPENYISYLNESGINLKKNKYLSQALLADVLSLQTSDSVDAVCNYLFRGELSKRPTRIYLSRTTLTPPLINHYITTKGSFYNITTIVNSMRPTNLELGAATDLDWFGDGQVQTYRAGARINDLRLVGYKFSPFYYANTDHSFNHKGYSAGLEVKKKLKENVDLRFKVENNKNDLLESVVKLEDEGWNFVLGIDIKF